MPKGRSYKGLDADVRDQLRLLNENLERLNDTMLSVIDSLKGSLQMRGGKPLGQSEHLDADRLLSLPDHLRRTAVVIARLGEGTAAVVSRETGRVRAAESDYLNQLVAMGYLRKKRVDRDIVFSIVK